MIDLPRCIDCHGKTEALIQAPAFDRPESTYELNRCRSCGLISTSAAPEEVANAYHQEYFGSSDAKFLYPVEWLISQQSKREARQMMNYCPCSRPRVLDIGCGRGQLMQQFLALDCEVEGIERHEYPVSTDLSDRIYVGSLSDRHFEDEHYDLIILRHVLEHVDQPGELIDEITRHLSPGGVLIVTVPNFQSFQSRLFKGNWFHLDLPRHLYHFDADWLSSRFDRAGFNVIQVSHWEPVQGVYGFLQSTLNLIRPGNRLYRLLNTASQNSLWLLPWLLGAAIILPFACLETILSTLLRCGATVTLVARGSD
jgi:SAM-dependent methyltransferase